MKLTKITLEDWAGIYDAGTGKLITQGHRIDYDVVLLYLKHDRNEIEIDDSEKLSEFGHRLPDNLNELLEHIKK